MEKLRRQIPKEEGPENLDDFFMELFTSDFLESLPPKQIETVIGNLKLVESRSVTVPPQWSALKNVLQKRGCLE